MNQSSIDIMNRNARHFLTIKDGYIRGLNEHEKNDLLKVMHDEFNPNYIVDWWCGACALDFMRLLDRLYKDKQAHEAATIPPVEKVKANFPQHKKKP